MIACVDVDYREVGAVAACGKLAQYLQAGGRLLVTHAQARYGSSG
jgi:hypothetical protein